MDKYQIEKVIGEPVNSRLPLGGGCIAKVTKIATDSGRLLVLKESSFDDMMIKEANGLREIEKAGVISVPEVISSGKGYLVMSFIHEGLRSPRFFENFGTALARLHLHSSSTFGFHENNYIGATRQLNIPDGDEATDWTSFYLSKRLIFQFKLAEQNGYVDARFRSLFQNIEKQLPTLFSGSEEPPSLLHGDLWAGNFLCDTNGDAVLIDPAVYYGHREAELAMTKLFGGFSPAFYEAYNAQYPLKDGYIEREPLYSLYHVLNHLNLFGVGYRIQALNLMEIYI